jgi:hypothetical protein
LYITIIYLRDGETVLIAGSIAVIAIGGAYKIYYSWVVAFDQEKMYLSGVGFNEEIALKQVSAVKITSFAINKMHFWKIVFTDNDNEERSVTFWPVYKTLGLFMDKVKEKNPAAELNRSIFY